MIINAGDFFRHYRVIEKVGAGGMGVVYRAHDTKLHRDVALKFMLHAPRLDSEQGERLWREARTLAALSHPNILTIHEIGDADDMPFLVFEWMGGGTLLDALLTQPLPAREFLRIALPIAEALGAAHEHGIVHRDVKPANVLMAKDGRIKLADFGLARFHDLDDATRTAGAVGTVAYMSPEQAVGKKAGPASDIFSFGVLAHELLTGHRPFQGNTPGEVIGAILGGRRARLSDVRPELPDRIVSIVEQCLEHNPTARFQTGKEAARALRRLVDESMGRNAIDAAESGVVRGSVARATSDQQIRFCTTADGISLAYSTIGNGPILVRVLGHFTHLEMEWEWPDLRRFWEELAERHTVIRYDGRGMGLSDPYAGDFTEETRLLDLEAVLTAAGAEQAVLLGISEGGWTAAAYAIRHPQRITHLILYGAYSRGAQVRPGYDAEEDQALVTLIRKGWGRDTPAFRQVFTSQFFRSDADPRLIAHFNALQRASADPETAARYYESSHRRGHGRDMYRQVKTPTLVIHCRDDIAVSAEEGRLLASMIPGAQLVLLPSGTHYFPTDAGVVTKVTESIARFLKGSEERRL